MTYWDQAYADGSAVRRWPNEELVRFFGRRYFHIPHAERSQIGIVEAGCGAGANLRMIKEEGFWECGQDSSQEALMLCIDRGYRVTRGDMQALRFAKASVDCVCDVFSSYCLNQSEFETFLTEVKRVLKPGGRFFSYAPSWGDREQAFPGNDYPWRFITPWKYARALHQVGLDTPYCETVSRTYGGRPFEFTVIEGLSPH